MGERGRGGGRLWSAGLKASFETPSFEDLSMADRWRRCGLECCLLSRQRGDLCSGEGDPMLRGKWRGIWIFWTRRGGKG